MNNETNLTDAGRDAFLRAAGFSHGWDNLESQARRMVEQAMNERAEFRDTLTVVRMSSGWRAMSDETKALVESSLRKARGES